jgi:hypothetical protein
LSLVIGVPEKSFRLTAMMGTIEIAAIPDPQQHGSKSGCST